MYRGLVWETDALQKESLFDREMYAIPPSPPSETHFFPLERERERGLFTRRGSSLCGISLWIVVKKKTPRMRTNLAAFLEEAELFLAEAEA